MATDENLDSDRVLDVSEPAPSWCEGCEHWVVGEHECAPCDRCEHVKWQNTADDEFPITDSDRCVYVGPGDDCWCHFCARYDAESERAGTEQYWRERIIRENREAAQEDDRKPQRDAVARTIADSEAFMWLMVGANHPEAHLETLRRVYSHYTSELDGGYGRWRNRHRLTDDQRAELHAATAHLFNSSAGNS